MSTTAPSVAPLSKLLSRHEVAECTKAFQFEKPTGWTIQSGSSYRHDPTRSFGNGHGRKCADVFNREWSSRSEFDGGNSPA